MEIPPADFRRCFVDSKKFSAFLTVQNLGNLTKAAESLNYTQSGMTHMMNALEKELGVTLLRRGRNGVSLTPDGARLLPKITAFVEAAAALETELDELKGSRSAHIRVGAYSSMAQHWLPEIVRRFRQEVPDTSVELRMASMEENYAMLHAGELDCAFVSYQSGEFTGDLAWIPLHNDELVAVLPENYPIRGALFSVSDFSGQEFLMPSSGFDRDIRPVFTRNHVRPKVRVTDLDDPAIISMVEHGLGLSLLSELVMRGRHDRVLALPLTPPAYRELGIALPVGSESREPLGRFIRHARVTVMDLYRA